MKFESIDAASSKELLDNGAALPVDIRQPNERAREHIRWARLVSLPRSSVEDVEQDGDETAVSYCQDGGRSKSNAQLLA